MLCTLNPKNYLFQSQNICYSIKSKTNLKQGITWIQILLLLSGDGFVVAVCLNSDIFQTWLRLPIMNTAYIFHLTFTW